MGAGLVAVVDPVRGAGGQDDGEQRGGQRPDGGAGGPQAGDMAGRPAPAFATMAVPMTVAYQLGPNGGATGSRDGRAGATAVAWGRTGLRRL